MRLRAQSVVPASLCLLLCLNGCFVDTLVKSPRSLGPGQKSLSLSASYLEVSGSQKHQDAAPPPYLEDPDSLSGNSQFWLSNAEFRMGTWYPGLEGGLNLSMAGALTGDLKYQFYGYDRNPLGQAAALDLELSALEPFVQENENATAGYGIAGVLSVGDHFGPADIFIGGRLGMVNLGPNQYDSQYYLPSNRYGYITPGRYSYYDFYLGSELEILPRASLLASITMRTLIDQPYDYQTIAQNYGYAEGGTFKTAFDPIFIFSLGLKFHSRLRPLTPAEQKEKDAADADKAERRKAKRRRKLGLEDDEALPDDPVVLKNIAAGQDQMHKGDYAGAVATLTPLENPNAPNFELEMSLGYCYYMQKSWQYSLSHYQEALRLEPKNDKLRSTVEKLKKKAGEADAKEDEDLLPK